MIANPADASPFDADGEWEALRFNLEPLINAGQLELIRLPGASENALQQGLGEEGWQVFHLLARGRSRGAQYVTLALEGEARKARGVTASHLGRLLHGHAPLQLVVLQACPDGEAKPLWEAAAQFVAEGVPAVITIPTAPSMAPAFLSTFYSRLVAGESFARAVVPGDRKAAQPAAKFHGTKSDGGFFPAPERSLSSVYSTIKVEDPAAAATLQATAAGRAIKAELEHRRTKGAFDVFLCHNSTDKPEVKKIGRQLMERGILPWLDDWELRPGMPWQRLLEDQIAGIASAAVFVGADGIGPWQLQELDAFLRQFVSRKCPVIPVLLTKAPREPKLPVFLQGVTWVDFRRSDADPIDRLTWGVTGRPMPLD